jgi:hypothetical protein
MEGLKQKKSGIASQKALLKETHQTQQPPTTTNSPINTSIPPQMKPRSIAAFVKYFADNYLLDSYEIPPETDAQHALYVLTEVSHVLMMANDSATTADVFSTIIINEPAVNCFQTNRSSTAMPGCVYI